MFPKTPKKRTFVGIGAIVLSILLIAGYATPAFANFNLILDVGTSGAWDDGRVDRACVIQDGSEYKMWYSGYNGSNYQIGLATSSDGFMWTKHPGNPVLTAGSSGRFDEVNVLSPWVIKDGTTYKMWYSGAQAGAVWRIGYATSPDGISWTKVDGAQTDQSVLDLGGGGQWDDEDVWHCCVIKNETDDFEMWYTGNDGTNNRIGHASSSDGISWTKTSASNPVLNLANGGTWDDSEVRNPCVIKEGVSAYRIWYSGTNASNTDKIGRATSSDGLTWTKNVGPVFSESGQAGDFDENAVFAPCVILDGSTYKMWYTGEAGASVRKLGYATSNDGITWTRTQIPEFQTGSLGILVMLMLTMGIAIPVIMKLVYIKRNKRN
jgi:predicted GH43/DUF377 family glycosyl hydrolase